MDETECTHPRECWSQDEDGMACGWCEEIERTAAAQATIQQLVACLEKRAIVNHGGELTIMTPDPIGYVAQYGGSLRLASPEFETLRAVLANEPAAPTKPQEPDRKAIVYAALLAACRDLASLKGTIPTFLGSGMLEAARDSAIAAAKLADELAQEPAG